MAKTARAKWTLMVLMALMVTSLIGCGGKSTQDSLLSDTQRAILLDRFTPLAATGSATTTQQSAPLQHSPQIKRKVSPESPLNVITWYGNQEGLAEFWKLIPSYVQDISVLVLIPGNVLKPGGDPEGLVETATACNELKIPFVIQNINGETHRAWNPPMAWFEKTFVPMEYFYGLSSAELYNGEEWRGQLDGDNAQYITDMIEFCATYGLMFAWTDTNIFGTNGTIIDWIEENEQLYNAMKAHPEHIIMQNKESYGDPSTYSLMKGLYMAGLIGGWGVATDWWHWQVSEFKSLFGVNNRSIDSAWEQIFWYPEALQSQSLMFVSSSGGTAFKNEAQFYSVAVQNLKTKKTARTATFEYATLPFFNALLQQDFEIPSRETVLEQATFAMVGGENYQPIDYRKRAKTWHLWPLKWLPFQDVAYSLKESTLYPNTPDYGIIPLLPANLRSEERALLGSYGIDLLDTKMTKKLLAPYAEANRANMQGDTFAADMGDQKYYLNNLENIDKEKSATFYTFCYHDIEALEVTAGPHTYAMVREEPGALRLHINNYRLDKEEMITSLDGSESPQQALYDWVTVDADSGKVRKADDSTLRTTTISLTLPTGYTPEVRILQGIGENADETATTASATITPQAVVTSEGKQHMITLHHNGPVDLTIGVPELAQLKSDAGIADTAQVPVSNSTPESPSTSSAPTTFSPEAEQLQKTIDQWAYVAKSPHNYTETSYHNFYKAWSAGNVALQEGRHELYASLTTKITQATELLLDITEAVAELNKFTTLTQEQRNSPAYIAYGNAFDRLIREILSPTLWYKGKDSTLAISNKAKEYTKKLFIAKTEAIDKALQVLREAYREL